MRIGGGGGKNGKKGGLASPSLLSFEGRSPRNESSSPPFIPFSVEQDIICFDDLSKIRFFKLSVDFFTVNLTHCFLAAIINYLE